MHIKWKKLLPNNNASSRKNLTLDTNAGSSLLYAQKSKHNSIVCHGASETVSKRTTGFYARKDNPLSLVDVVTTKRDNIYDTHRDIYTLDHLTQEHNYNEDVSQNSVTNEIEGMESVQKNESLTTDNIIIIK